MPSADFLVNSCSHFYFQFRCPLRNLPDLSAVSSGHIGASKRLACCPAESPSLLQNPKGALRPSRGTPHSPFRAASAPAQWASSGCSLRGGANQLTLRPPGACPPPPTAAPTDSRLSPTSCHTRRRSGQPKPHAALPSAPKLCPPLSVWGQALCPQASPQPLPRSPRRSLRPETHRAHRKGKSASSALPAPTPPESLRPPAPAARPAAVLQHPPAPTLPTAQLAAGAPSPRRDAHLRGSHCPQHTGSNVQLQLLCRRCPAESFQGLHILHIVQ